MVPGNPDIDETRVFFLQEFVGVRRALIFMIPYRKRRKKVFAVELRSICALIVFQERAGQE